MIETYFIPRFMFFSMISFIIFLVVSVSFDAIQNSEYIIPRKSFMTRTEIVQSILLR